MKIFIWKEVAGLTNNWHDGGGVAVVAEDLESARKALVEDGVRTEAKGDHEICEALTKDPDGSYQLVDAEGPAIFYFPNAGCC